MNFRDLSQRKISKFWKENVLIGNQKEMSALPETIKCDSSENRENIIFGFAEFRTKNAKMLEMFGEPKTKKQGFLVKQPGLEEIFEAYANGLGDPERNVNDLLISDGKGCVHFSKQGNLGRNVFFAIVSIESKSFNHLALHFICSNAPDIARKSFGMTEEEIQTYADPNALYIFSPQVNFPFEPGWKLTPNDCDANFIAQAFSSKEVYGPPGPILPGSLRAAAKFASMFE